MAKKKEDNNSLVLKGKYKVASIRELIEVIKKDTIPTIKELKEEQDIIKAISVLLVDMQVVLCSMEELLTEEEIIYVSNLIINQDDFNCLTMLDIELACKHIITAKYGFLYKGINTHNFFHFLRQYIEERRRVMNVN